MFMKKECRLKYFPISFFSVILGMTGFTIASQKIESILKLTSKFSSFENVVKSV